MHVKANAVLRSWTLLAAFSGSYAPDSIHVDTHCLFLMKIDFVSHDLIIAPFDILMHGQKMNGM